MDQRRDDAVRNYLAIMPTAEAFIPAMLDAFDVAGHRRQRLIEVFSDERFMSIFEQKHRAALAGLSTEDLEAITAFFGTQRMSSRSRLLVWAAGMVWAGRELMVYIEAEYDRLLTQEQPER